MRTRWLLVCLALLFVSLGTVAAQEGANDLPSPSFAVTDIFPQDGAQFVGDQPIVVIFNRPVVPLITSASDPAALVNPLLFDPALDGQGEWINSSIYQFTPGAVASGTTYQVRVDPALTSLDGLPLSEPFASSFTTSTPGVIRFEPGMDDDAALPDAPIIITFNMPVDRAAAEASLIVRADGGRIAGTVSWDDTSTTLTFTPTDRYPFGALVQVEAGKDVPGAGGGVGSAQNGEWAFDVVPLPAVVSSWPEDGETEAGPYGGITIYFASPMNIDTLRDRIVVEPEPWREGDAFYSNWDYSYTVAFPTEPSTDYTITLLPGMEDIFGNAIADTTVIRYRTDSYYPTYNLRAPNVGYFNAYNPRTQVFLTQLNTSSVDMRLYEVQPRWFVDALGESFNGRSREQLVLNSDVLAEWTVVSTAPENVQRYDLLDLGAAVYSPDTFCPGAPDARLAVGMEAVVATEDVLRLRDEPVVGEIQRLLEPGSLVTILSGPQCQDSYRWYEVAIEDGATGWVAEGDITEYYLEPTTTTETVLETAPDTPTALPPGLYLLQASSESVEMGPDFSALVVATLNVTLKSSPDQLLAWVTDMSTGLPVEGVTLSLYDSSRGLVDEVVTDSTGLARADMPTPSEDRGFINRTVIARAEGHFGVGWTGWSDGLDGWNFGVQYDSQPDPYQIYLYSDRPIYRPEQPVYFRGIARENNDLTYNPFADGHLQVRIYDPDNNIVLEQMMRTSPFGTFDDTFDIPADAMLGTYRLSVFTEGMEDYESWRHSYSFDVQEYRAPEFEVTVTPEVDEVAAGDTIRALVNARYFFGGNVSGGTVDYTVISAPYYFNPDVTGFWSWEDYDADAGASEFYYFGGGEIASGTGVLDADGSFLIELPAELEDATQSQRFTIEAIIADESGQAVAGRASVTVHKGEFYIGVQPDSYVGQVGQETVANFIAVDWEGSPLPNQTIAVEVVERRWFSVQEQDDSGRTTWSYDVEEIPLTEGMVTTDANGRATFTFVPPNGGIFKVRAVSTDANSRPIISAATTWVVGDEYISWRQQNSNRIDLVVGSPSYAVGDTAEILITSPFQGESRALVTVERGGILHTDVITLATNSYLYQLPITEDMIPVAYVSVIIVNGASTSEAGSIAYPQFRMGLTQLTIDSRERTLTIELTPDVSSMGASPGDTIVWTVRTTDAEGQPVSAEVGLGLTDQAVLSITPRTERDIVNHFYGSRPLNVSTSTGLTSSVDQITQEVLDTVKGGGGGFGEGGIFDIREEFIDTPFWEARIITDENGLAEVSTTLPDNLTTWVMDARAITLGGETGPTLVGQTTYELLSTLPVLVRPVTPRFFIAGDQVTLAAIVNNNTGDTYEAVVALDAAGVTFADGVSAEQTVMVPAGGRVRVEWPVNVVDDLTVTDVDLTFYASAGNGLYNDASKPPLGQGDGRLLPIYRYSAPETIGTAGVLREADTLTEIVSLPTALPITEARVDLNLSFSLAEVMLDALDWFDTNFNDSAEGTVSGFLPNIVTYNALQQLGAAEDPRFARLTRSLNREVMTALSRLYSLQHMDGGWGWYRSDRSSALTTAYVVIALAEARDAGYTVTASVLSNGVSYLQDQVSAVTVQTPDWRLNRQAFMLYALARAGAPVSSSLNNLFELRDRLSFYAQGFLLKAFVVTSGVDSPQVIALRDGLIAGATLSATGASWDDRRDYYNWNTDTRTTAIALSALIDVDPTNGLLPNIVRWLVSVRAGDSWETTQETTWSVMALADWLVATGELDAAYSYSAAVADVTALEGAVTPETVDLGASASVDLALGETPITVTRGEGTGPLYYTAHVSALLPVPAIEPLDNGIILQRRYTLPDDPTAVVTSAQVGDLITARLTIIAPNELHYVVITDPIPAGTDAVNPDLAIAPQVGTRPELDRIDPEQQGWGWWWWSRTEFRDEAVVLSAEYLPAGTYEFVYTIRAGLPGVYNVIPPTGQETYFPEVYGRGAGSTFTITPADGS